jgi:hypothetical protein
VYAREIVTKGESVSEMVSFDEMCEAVGKPPAYIRQLQSMFHLPLSRDHRYSAAFVNFVRKLVTLRAFSVPVDEITDLLRREKRLLELLHVDTIGNSPTWFLDHCNQGGRPSRRLLLTGYDVGFPLSSRAVQVGFDFGRKQRELFTGQEMGEDTRRVIDAYLKARRRVLDRVREQRLVLRQALEWARLTLR